MINESHNVYKKIIKPCFVSTDGVDAFNIDANLYRRRFSDYCEITFLWGSRFNLREDSDNLPPPKERTAIPDEKYMRAVIALSEREGIAPEPTFRGTVIPFSKPLLYKSFSEDKEGKDIRANKPMTITRSTSPELIAVDYTGREVCRFRYFGDYPPTLERHYSGTGSNLYGYEIADRARRLSSHPHVWFKDGVNYYGPVNPVFRKGYFQR
jgi:hypothetical protein